MAPLDARTQHLCLWNKNLAPPLPPPVTMLFDLRKDPATGLPYCQTLGSNSVSVPVDPSAPVRRWFPVKAKTRNGQNNALEDIEMGSDEGSIDSRSDLEIIDNNVIEELSISRKRSSSGEKVDAIYMYLYI
jgi:hypothetical protein